MNEKVLALMDRQEVVLLDGLDDCILGVCERLGYPDVVAYDKNKILSHLQEKENITEDEANVWLGNNTSGGWLGEYTPCFIEI